MRIPRNAVSAILAVAFLSACGDTISNPSPFGSTEQAWSGTIGTLAASAACGAGTSAALLDGPRGDGVGAALVTNDDSDLFVTVSAAAGLSLAVTHVSVSATPDGIPTNRGGNPVPGRFPISAEHEPPVSDFTYSVPLAHLGMGVGDEVVVAVHAELSDGTGAWAEGVRINGRERGRGSWAMYFTAVVEECGGTLEGSVVHALTGAAIGGATVDFGGDGSTTTAADGSFSLQLPAGTHTGEVSADDFISSSLTVSIVTGATTNAVVALSPVLADEEVRIVLTWGAEPRDLDSHLTGPIPGSGGRFHVYWRASGSLTSSPFAELDIDDVTSFGPETITIAQRFDGTYRYSVHDWTNRFESFSTGLAESGATVRVFQGAVEVASFTPPDQDGTVWTVFELDGISGDITPVGAMGYESNPAAILYVGGRTDLAALLAAPPDHSK